MPGAAIGILRGGTVTTACYGVADVTTGAPVTPETRFAVGSLAKPMGASKSERGKTEAFAHDERSVLPDPMDPDTPTVTFGAFDAAGRPGVLYEMLGGLPRLEE